MMSDNGHVKSFNASSENARVMQNQANTQTETLIAGLYDAAANIRQQAHDNNLEGEALRGVHDLARRYERAALYLQGSSAPETPPPARIGASTNAVGFIATFVIGVIVGLLVDNARDK